MATAATAIRKVGFLAKRNATFVTIPIATLNTNSLKSIIHTYTSCSSGMGIMYRFINRKIDNIINISRTETAYSPHRILFLSN